MKRLLFIALLMTGCASEEEICAEKLAKLSALRNEARADLFRLRSECKALQIEFGSQDIVRSCMETYRLMEEVARETLADIDKRMREPDMALCASRAREKRETERNIFDDLIPRQ